MLVRCSLVLWDFPLTKKMDRLNRMNELSSTFDSCVLRIPRLTPRDRGRLPDVYQNVIANTRPLSQFVWPVFISLDCLSLNGSTSTAARSTAIIVSNSRHSANAIDGHQDFRLALQGSIDTEHSFTARGQLMNAEKRS
jgi:hypothetical protein